MCAWINNGARPVGAQEFDELKADRFREAGGFERLTRKR
jgi:hypothetical protein